MVASMKDVFKDYSLTGVLNQMVLVGAATSANLISVSGVLDDIKQARKEFLVKIPGGTFEMGSPRVDTGDHPVHSVTLDSFYMEATEVTNVAFYDLMGFSPSPDGFDAPTQPVVGALWSEASAYCGKKYVGGRLATEAEWEYAARAGRQCEFGAKSCMSIDERQANYNNGTTKAVASYPANGFGLYDMAGNAWEWTDDWYGPLSNGPEIQLNPTGPESGTHKVVRDGYWAYDHERYLRATHRTPSKPEVRTQDVRMGFRCVVPTKNRNRGDDGHRALYKDGNYAISDYQFL